MCQLEIYCVQICEKREFYTRELPSEFDGYLVLYPKSIGLNEKFVLRKYIKNSGQKNYETSFIHY